MTMVMTLIRAIDTFTVALPSEINKENC